MIAALVGSVVLIYLLPKSVVENEASLKNEGTAAMPDSHQKANPAVQQAINQLKAGFLSAVQAGNSPIFADSLAHLYQKADKYDSAAWVLGQANTFFESPENALKAADAYYKAFTFAVNAEKRKELAQKAGSLYQSLLAQKPSDLDIKTKLALTFMVTESPMQGVSMLREVIAENPTHQSALFNMGMLSVQSGQIDKALGWLKTLMEHYPDDVQGRLLYGVALAEHGDKAEAREQFLKAKELDADPAVQQQADAYLKDLK